MSTFTPGQPSFRPDPFAFAEKKGLGALLSSAWQLWRKQPGVFFLTAAVVVIPFEVVVLGLIGGGFHDPVGEANWQATVASGLFMSTAGSALVTAIHARAVVALSRGEQLTTASAFALGTTNFVPVLLAVLLDVVATTTGFLLLIIPGIFLSVACMFMAVEASLNATRPVAAFKRSIGLVRENGWWRTLGYVIVLTLVTAIVVGVVTIVFEVLSAALGEPSDLGAVAVPVQAIAEAAGMSWSALVLTLLYFSWRAGADDPYPGGAPVAPTGIPGTAD